MNLFIKQKQIHRLREGIHGYQEERVEARRGIVSEFEIGMYTLLYLKWITNMGLLYSTWNSGKCYVAGWIGGEFGGEWIHVYEWLSPFAVHLKLSLCCLLIGYSPTQNKKLKNKI